MYNPFLITVYYTKWHIGLSNFPQPFTTIGNHPQPSAIIGALFPIVQRSNIALFQISLFIEWLFNHHSSIYNRWIHYHHIYDYHLSYILAAIHIHSYNQLNHSHVCNVLSMGRVIAYEELGFIMSKREYPLFPKSTSIGQHQCLSTPPSSILMLTQWISIYPELAIHQLDGQA
jgi:hypothetical protein